MSSIQDIDEIFHQSRIKVVIIGDARVGKSNLLSRFHRDEFNIENRPTIGIEFVTKIIPVTTIHTIRAEIWDTSGQDRYRSVTPAYFRGSVGAIIVYDITNRQSFENVNLWLRDFQRIINSDIDSDDEDEDENENENGNKNVKILLVGNKTDQRNERQVKTEEGQDFAINNGLMFVETSALANDNIEKSFTQFLIAAHRAI